MNICNCLVPFMGIAFIAGDHTMSNKTQLFYYAVFRLKARVLLYLPSID